MTVSLCACGRWSGPSGEGRCVTGPRLKDRPGASPLVMRSRRRAGVLWVLPFLGCPLLVSSRVLSDRRWVPCLPHLLSAVRRFAIASGLACRFLVGGRCPVVLCISCSSTCLPTVPAVRLSAGCGWWGPRPALRLTDLIKPLFRAHVKPQANALTWGFQNTFKIFPTGLARTAALPFSTRSRGGGHRPSSVTCDQDAVAGDHQLDPALGRPAGDVGDVERAAPVGQRALGDPLDLHDPVVQPDDLVAPEAADGGDSGVRHDRSPWSVVVPAIRRAVCLYGYAPYDLAKPTGP